MLVGVLTLVDEAGYPEANAVLRLIRVVFIEVLPIYMQGLILVNAKKQKLVGVKPTA